MPHQPQPVPPIFQPEVAAEADRLGGRHPRRELSVGWPTVKAIVGNAVAPGFADRYLARNGYDAQQTDEPVDPDRARQPLRARPRRQAAHGPFDERARTRSAQLCGSTHAARRRSPAASRSRGRRHSESGGHR